MASNREKFTTRLRPRTLALLHDLAEREGRSRQSLVEEALADLFQKRRNAAPRPQVMAAYRRSLDRYDGLYRKLADS